MVSNAVGKDHADYNHIYHNTFYHNGHLATYAGFQGGMYFANWRNISPVGNVVKNNIFYDSKGDSVTYDGSVNPQIIETNWEDNAVDPGLIDLSGSDPDVADRPDLHLESESPAKDQGAWLTTITSPSGQGSSFEVVDANYFMDGWGIITGDRIQLEGQVVVAMIQSVDTLTQRITVDRSLSFTTGQGVALAYAGAAPELGAYEIPDEAPPGGDAGSPAADSGRRNDGSDGRDSGEALGDGGLAAKTDERIQQPREPIDGCSCASSGHKSKLQLSSGLWLCYGLGMLLWWQRRESRRPRR